MSRTRTEPEITWNHTPRIDPGQYRAFARSAKVYRDPQFKRWVCAVHFDVLSEDLVTVRARLTWFLNLGNAESPHAGRRGIYRGAWIIANGRQPKRSDRLSPRVFTNRYAVVLVGDTTKDFKQSSVGEDAAYSVVRNVLRWDNGGRKQ
jgi:hypothetical protein